jgi:uroporphyrinogen-III synthase
MQARLRRRGRSLAHRPSGLRIAAVGRKTAQRLDDLGAPADFVPPAFVADSLIEHFPCSAWGLRLLIPRVQSGGRTLLAEAFAEAGARVVEVAAYETGCPPGLPSRPPHPHHRTHRPRASGSTSWMRSASSRSVASGQV